MWNQGSAWASTALRRAARPASFRTVAWLLAGAALAELGRELAQGPGLEVEHQAVSQVLQKTGLPLVLVEQDPGACDVIRSNIDLLGCGDRATLVPRSVELALEEMERTARARAGYRPPTAGCATTSARIALAPSRRSPGPSS